MLRITFWHTPNYFQFYLRDSETRHHASLMASDEVESNGIAVRQGEISIRTLSEYSEVPIAVEYDNVELESADTNKWDHVVECSIEARSGKLVLEGCTAASPFGEVDLPSGEYRVRIYFGGQLTGKRDGSTEDCYLLQIWPSSEKSIKVLKGDRPWPRPKQPWEI